MIVHNWLAFSSLCGVRGQLAPTTICLDTPNSTKYLSDSSLVKIYKTTGWKHGRRIKIFFFLDSKTGDKNDKRKMRSAAWKPCRLYPVTWFILQMFMTGSNHCLKHVTVIATTVNFSTNKVQNKIFRNALQCLNFPCFCFWKVVGRWHMRQITALTV